jgi:hypothetical protein
VKYERSQDLLEGPYGRAFRIDLDGLERTEETVCSWVITSPIWHPSWSQYWLNVVRLRFGVPGFPDPVLRFAGATHELSLVVLDPHRGPWTRTKVAATKRQLPFLLPVNIAEQFTATDVEMATLAAFCAVGVLHGALNPETSDAPERIREDWLSSMVKTLAHMRGEDHAR